MVSQSEGTSAAGAVPRPAGGNPLGASSWNVPNAITVARLILALILFTMISASSSLLGIPAAVVFLLAAATDAVDGYIARKYNLITVLGRILDPFADKIIVCGTFIFLLVHPASGVNAWMVAIVVGREMFVTGLRSFLEQQGKDFSASWSGKIKMILQCAAIVASLLSFTATFANPGFLLFRDVLLWSSVVATLYSGWVYVIRAIKLFRS